MMKKSLLLLALAVISLQLSAFANAQTLLVLNQGEEIKLPEDFVARLDGKNLKVALKSLGLAERNVDRELMVSLIQENGAKVSLKPDAKGELTFTNVKEGLAALVVAGGPLSYAAIPFYAAPKTKPADDSPVNVKPFEVPVATVDSGLVRSSVETSGTAASGESVRKLDQYGAMAANRFQVRLRPNGDLVGRVIVPESGFDTVPGVFQLSFFRNGQLVGQSSSSDDGRFVVSGLTSGIHSVFATGPAGHAAYAFDVLAAKDGEEIPARLSSRANPGSKLVSKQGTELVALNVIPGDELIVLVVPPRLMPQVRETVRQAYPQLPPAPDAGIVDAPFLAPGMGAPGVGGGFAGGAGGIGGGGLGGGGAGAGGGGLGGAGGLLGIAGLAIGVAALADSDDGFNPPNASRLAQ